jgi:hypothetical protein
MAQRKTLTEAQVALLRWIADGSPDGVMDGESYKISAAALRSRGQVTISGRGATWAAELTDAGRDYLSQVDGQEPPIPRQPNVSVTEQLVKDVIAAGGCLRVPRPRWTYDWDGVDYENRARLATRFGKVPDGKRLALITLRDELELRLVDAPGRRYGRGELAPVTVPEKVGRYHPAARTFRASAEQHEVSRAILPRATRIIHAIAVEATRRGWSAECSDGFVRIVAEDHAFSLRLHEHGVHTRSDWEREVRHYRDIPRDSYFYRDRVLPRGRYDAGATGQLTLELGGEGEFPGRQSRWGDRQSWSLEERLAHLFREIEERIVEAQHIAEDERVAAEERRLAAQREAEDRERTWHRLMAEARERFLEDYRAAKLREQASAWQTADVLRRYCDAMEAAHGGDEGAADWLAWARAHVRGIDPLRQPPTMPEQPEAGPEDLQRYFPAGWSARGPGTLR